MANPIDYAALAKQFGGTTVPAPSAPPAGGGVDYAALAKKFGGTTVASPMQSKPLLGLGAGEKKDGSAIAPLLPTDKSFGSHPVMDFGAKALFGGADALGRPLAAAAVAGLGLDKSINASSDAEAESRFHLAKLLNDPNISPAAKAHVRSQLGQGLDVGVATKQIPELNTTNKEIAGAAIDTALTVASAGGLKGAAAPTAKLGRYLGYAGQGAAYGGAAGAATALKNNQGAADVAKNTLRGATAGAGLGVAVPAAIDVGSAGMKKLYSTLSGVPKQAVDRLVANPDGTLQKVREIAGNKEGAQQDILDKFDEAVGQLRKDRSSNYEAGLASMDARTLVSRNDPNKMTDELVSSLSSKDASAAAASDPAASIWWKNDQGGWDKTDMTVKGVKDTFTKTMKDFGFSRGANGYEIGKAAMPKSDLNNLNELMDRVYNWDDFTPTGMNDLRKVVDSYEGGYEKRALNSIVGNLKGNLSSYIEKHAPGAVGGMNAAYASASDQLDKLRQAFGSDKTPDQTKINRLIGMFKSNSVFRKDLISSIGKAQADGLMNDVLAYHMSQLMPHGGLTKKLFESLGVAGGALAMLGGHAGGVAALPGAAMSSPLVGAEIIGVATKSAPVLKGLGRAAAPFFGRGLGSAVVKK